MKSGSSSLAVLMASASMLMASMALAQEGSFMVRPTRLDLHARAGARVSSAVQILVAGETVGTIDTRLDSFSLDANGQPHAGIDPAGRGLSRWVKLSRSATASSQTIELEIEVPLDAAGTYWSVLMIEGQATRMRMAVPIFVTVEATEERRVEIRSMGAVVSGRELVVSSIVRNVGNALIQATFAVALERAGDSAAGEIASSEIQPILLLPNHERVVTSRIPIPTADLANVVASIFLKWGERVGEAAVWTCGIADAPRPRI